MGIFQSDARSCFVVTWRTYGTRGSMRETGFYPHEAPMGLKCHNICKIVKHFNGVAVPTRRQKDKSYQLNKESLWFFCAFDSGAQMLVHTTNSKYSSAGRNTGVQPPAVRLPELKHNR